VHRLRKHSRPHRGVLAGEVADILGRGGERPVARGGGQDAKERRALPRHASLSSSAAAAGLTQRQCSNLHRNHRCKVHRNHRNGAPWHPLHKR
jgi:hypothetical protein